MVAGAESSHGQGDRVRGQGVGARYQGIEANPVSGAIAALEGVDDGQMGLNHGVEGADGLGDSGLVRAKLDPNLTQETVGRILPPAEIRVLVVAVVTSAVEADEVLQTKGEGAAPPELEDRNRDEDVALNDGPGEHYVLPAEALRDGGLDPLFEVQINQPGSMPGGHPIHPLKAEGQVGIGVSRSLGYDDLTRVCVGDQAHHGLDELRVGDATIGGSDDKVGLDEDPAAGRHDLVEVAEERKGTLESFIEPLLHNFHDGDAVCWHGWCTSRDWPGLSILDSGGWGKPRGRRGLRSCREPAVQRAGVWAVRGRENGLLLGFAFHLLDEGLNLVNQYRQIRLTEAHLRRWEAVMFGIWADVFVVRMSAF